MVPFSRCDKQRRMNAKDKARRRKTFANSQRIRQDRKYRKQALPASRPRMKLTKQTRGAPRRDGEFFLATLPPPQEGRLSGFEISPSQTFHGRDNVTPLAVTLRCCIIQKCRCIKPAADTRPWNGLHRDALYNASQLLFIALHYRHAVLPVHY